MIVLSILICSTPERKDMFTVLFNELHKQLGYIQTFHPILGEVEILVDDTKRFLDGGLSIGKKRESLLMRASGEYLCYLDCDDAVPGNYLESLLRLCRQKQDVCTFRAIAKLESFTAIVDMRLCYKVNDQLNPEYTIRRPPWLCCPVKSEYAKRVKFNDKNNAEDFEWMEKVLTHCTTESHTDKILFTYQHGSHSEADKIPLP